MRKTIRVLIVDDHAIVREGYRALLAKHEGITVVGEACDAASAYQCYKDKQPDVVIMDISMPGRGGIDAIKHIREFDAHARVLVFTMHSGAAYVQKQFSRCPRGRRESRFGWSSRDLPRNCSGSGFRSGAPRKIAA